MYFSYYIWAFVLISSCLPARPPPRSGAGGKTLLRLGKNLQNRKRGGPGEGGGDGATGGGEDGAMGGAESTEFFLPPGYNKLLIPTLKLANGTILPVFATISLDIREVLEVNLAEQVITLDTIIHLWWTDWEIWTHIKYGNVTIPDMESEEITLESEFLEKIWKPDIDIDELSAVEKATFMSQLVRLRVSLDQSEEPGRVSYTAKQRLKLRCEMDFTYYPADTQTCMFHIKSFSYDEEQLLFLWKGKDGAFLAKTFDSNYVFQLVDVEPLQRFGRLRFGNTAGSTSSDPFSTLSLKIKIRRNIGFHLVQTYIPAVLLILVTWLCFLLPTNMVETRIAISMTTLLTLTATFAGVRQQSPAVSYTMAVDIWMIFCVLFVFVALVLFTFIYWMKQKATRRMGTIRAESAGNEVNANVLYENKSFQTQMRIVRHIKRNAFWIFALVFCIFLIIYSACILFGSELLEWSPSPQFNVLPGKPNPYRSFGNALASHGRPDNELFRESVFEDLRQLEVMDLNTTTQV